MKSLQSYVQIVKRGREPVCEFKEQGDGSGHEERQLKSACTGDRRTGKHIARSGCWKTVKPSRKLGSSNMERLAGNCFAEGLGKET